jgi:DNA-binding NarL/FixJ family response regulator
VKKLQVLIADDHDLMRRGIKALIESHDNWTVCAEARTGREAVDKAESTKPDVAIIDISMPELNGIDAARRIKAVAPRTEVLILSIHYSDQVVRDVINSGIRGFVVKSDSERDLVMAVEALSKHRAFFTPLATQAMLNNLEKPEEAEPAETRLTTREREILQLLSEGKSSKEVASVLNISVKTAETHRSNLMGKLGLHNVSELVRYAVRNRIIQI